MTDCTTRYLADYCAPLFTINNVELTFELDEHSTKVTSLLSVVRQGEHQQPLVLMGEQLTLLSLSLNDLELESDKYQLNEKQLEIPLTLNEFALKVVVEIDPAANTALEGLYKSGDAFCTQCEAEGFRRITYYLDRPDVMAVFTTKVIADRAQYPKLLSNGNNIASGTLPDGKHFVTWFDPFPKPSYLFALVAGDFDLLSDTFITQSGRQIALEIFVDKGNLAKAHHAMNSLKSSMRWDEQTFDLEYDLDIYMIVAVDFFNMGAMENKGLNVFNSKFVLVDSESATDTDYFNVESVIAHEYFHNWTGNRVTCRDWFQLSLKEGLTVFRDQQFSADQHAASVTRIQNVRNLRAHQFAEDAGPMAHPIRPEKVMEMNNFYTATVYEKGAEVIRMIHTLLGQEKFKQGMALYFSRFDGMAVTCDDFVDAMADAAQVDLTQFKHWYSQSGTPVISVAEQYLSATKQFRVTLQQKLPSSSAANKVNLHIPVSIEIIDQTSHATRNHLLELTEHSQTWLFDDYDNKPVVAMLAGFSAPVKVVYQQSNDELQTVLMAAQDDFCRWDAGQTLFSRLIKTLVANGADSILTLQFEPLVQAFAKILGSNADHAFIAEQLTLPGFDEMIGEIDGVDPSALVQAIHAVQYRIAEALQPQFLSRYQECYQQYYQNDKRSVTKRSLKNICLSYLSMLDEAEARVITQFDQADNMTDTLAALTCAAKNNLACYSSLMNLFEKRWFNTPLVMDKWFTLNATLNSETIFAHLTALLAHPLFSLKNPNRARALIGAFAQFNPKYFHCPSGRGYQFLATQIALLNDINPQVASRLLTPLIQFRAFEPQRQLLMKQALLTLSRLPNLSLDLLEKLNAALAS